MLGAGRRIKLARLAVAALIAGPIAATAPPLGPPALSRHSARPNVLIVLTDDQRAGETLRVMPRTRKLFKRNGRKFNQAYATTPLCCPSRASIMSGRYAHNHGVRNNREIDKLAMRSTIQRYLDRAGYNTAYIGKFLNQWDLAKPPPHFDRWTIGRAAANYYNLRWNIDGRLRRVSRYTTDFVARRSVKLLHDFEATDESPWLLYVATGAPHVPATPEPAYDRAPVAPWRKSPAILEQDRSDKPPGVRGVQPKPRYARRLRRRQLRSLMSVDDLVGRVMRTLRDLGERRSTLAIFLSDNGQLWNDHGLVRGRFHKRHPYTYSVRIPLLVRWPGHVPRGTIDDRLVANIDIAPTVLEAARVTPDRAFPIDGRSLLDPGARERLLLEYFVDAGPPPAWASIRTARYQYVEYYGEDGSEVTFREYYDLADDPWQLDNLLGDDRADNDPSVSGIARQLDADRSCAGGACP